MKLIIKKNVEAMSQTLAHLIYPYVTSSNEQLISLTAGSSPIRGYQILKELLAASDSSISTSIHFVQQDNLYLSTKPQEYKRFEYINKSFFEANAIPDNQITYLTEETYGKIDELIAEKGGLEVAFMGIGADGHIAANMPGTDFTKNGYRVMLDPKFAAMVNASGEVTADIDCYVSIGMKTLMQAKKIIVIAAGESKAAILAQAFKGPLTTDVPASILQFHPDVTILCDQAAAALLV